MQMARSVMIELHSTGCRCRGASYMWDAGDRACGCSAAVPADAIVLGIADWLSFKKPRNAEETHTRRGRDRAA
jgi:hypothetical protein